MWRQRATLKMRGQLLIRFLGRNREGTRSARTYLLYYHVNGSMVGPMHPSSHSIWRRIVNLGN